MIGSGDMGTCAGAYPAVPCLPLAVHLHPTSFSSHCRSTKCPFILRASFGSTGCAPLIFVTSPEEAGTGDAAGPLSLRSMARQNNLL